MSEHTPEADFTTDDQDTTFETFPVYRDLASYAKYSGYVVAPGTDLPEYFAPVPVPSSLTFA